MRPHDVPSAVRPEHGATSRRFVLHSDLGYHSGMAAPRQPTARPPADADPEPTHYIPQKVLTAEEWALLARDERDPVDFADALRWLRGEGPDRWREPSR